MGKESSEALGKRVSRERGGGTARGIKAHRSPLGVRPPLKSRRPRAHSAG